MTYSCLPFFALTTLPVILMTIVINTWNLPSVINTCKATVNPGSTLQK